MWVLDQGDAEGALRMAVGLDRFWIFSVPPPDVRLAWLEAALGLPWSPSSVVGIRARAKAYQLAGLLKTRADPVAAQGLLQQGLVLFEKIGDQVGAAACVRNHGLAGLLVGDAEKGRREIAESLVRCQACGDELGVAWSCESLGIASFVLGEFAEASSYLLESTSQFERLDGPLGACHALVDLGLSLRHEGKLPAALNAYRNTLRYQREYRFTTETANSLDGIAVVAAALGHLDLAARLFGAASGWRETYQQEPWFPMPNDFQKSAASVRRRLGERAWFEAYEAGVKLNSEQAMRLAEEAVSALEEELQRRSVGLNCPGDRRPASGGRWADQRRDRRPAGAESTYCACPSAIDLRQAGREQPHGCRPRRRLALCQSVTTVKVVGAQCRVSRPETAHEGLDGAFDTSLPS